MPDYIDIHTHRKSIEDSVIEVYNKYPDEDCCQSEYYSMGIHPWFIQKYNFNHIENMFLEEAKNPNFVFIGECGLDRSIDLDIAIQKHFFIEQLRLAKKHKKGVIIHCVKAYSDILQILKSNAFNFPFIIHDYCGNKQQTDAFLKHTNIFFSLGNAFMQGRLKEPSLNSVIQSKRFFLETDENDYSIQTVYQFFTNKNTLNLEDIIQTIKENFMACIL